MTADLAPRLTLSIEQAKHDPQAVAPLLCFTLAVCDASAGDPPRVIQSIVLRCQIRIDAARRRYDELEREHLADLFGDGQDWDRHVCGMLWTHASTVITSFTGRTTAELPVPCTFDQAIGPTRYFEALHDGYVPLTFHFSGSIFYAGPGSRLQIAPISRDKEAAFRMPLRVWREMMDHHYPDTAWLLLRRSTFDRIDQFQRSRGLATRDQALESLLACAKEDAAT